MTDLQHERRPEPEAAAAPAAAAPPLSALIRTATRALQLRFSPAVKLEFIAALRGAQADIDAFIARGATMSPSCRRLLLRLATELECRVIAVSADAHRRLVRDRRAGRRDAPPAEPRRA
jgi:uncharacterized protein with PIN domain